MVYSVMVANGVRDEKCQFNKVHIQHNVYRGGEGYDTKWVWPGEGWGFVSCRSTQLRFRGARCCTLFYSTRRTHTSQ